MNIYKISRFYVKPLYIVPILLLGFTACGNAAKTGRSNHHAIPSVSGNEDGPVPVTLKHTENGWQLLRNGKPYFIKGAGGDQSKEVLRDCGGNSFRTWGADNVDNQLETARKYGLTVTTGIWLGHKEHGFNYNDPSQVANQLENAKKAVLKYRNSRPLLLWAVGNEMEGYDRGDDPAVWKAVDDICAMIKKIDPYHPCLSVVAEINPDKIAAINRYCPHLDILGVNCYAGGQSFAERYTKAGGVKPYILTEFGPPGTWEVGKNAWGAVFEFSSNEKANWYRRTYLKSIQNQPLCVGSYVFAWGNKQEATSTWFGMFLPDNSRLSAVDTMAELWCGKRPVNLCPVINSFKVDGKDEVTTNSMVHVKLDVTDPENDPVNVEYVLQYDPMNYEVGGADQMSPPKYPESIIRSDIHSADIKLPNSGGVYRLYAYIRDNHGGAAVSNVLLKAVGGEALSKGMRSELPLFIYTDDESPAYAPSGYMGNTGAIKMDDKCGEYPNTGTSCIKITFSAANDWGGVVWQNPTNDWGDRPGGLNLTGAKQLSFWARGLYGGETVSFVFGMLGPEKKYPDSTRARLNNMILKKDWTQYTIDLRGRDLSCIKTPFAWIAASKGQPVTFYLDDIVVE